MQKRIASFFCLLLVLLGGNILRILYLTSGGGNVTAATVQSTRTLTVSESRGNILDRDGEKLVNKGEKRMALIFPEIADLSLLSELVADESFAERARQSLPVSVETDGKILAAKKGVYSYSVPSRYEEPIAVHIIGYLNGGVGVSGMEKAYNGILKNGAKTKVTYSADATGRVLTGEEISVSCEEPDGKSSVKLTLSTDIQKLTETVLKENLKKGAAVVMDVENGEILAAASLPDFDPADISAALNGENSPFVNRCFTAYPVGSTWKLLLSSVALESGISASRTYDCRQSIKIEDTVFHCHWQYGHGEIDMETALRVSCNPYFIDLGQELGGEKILDMAKNLGFGTPWEYAPDCFSAAGMLPSADELKNKAALASFSFGQGKLLATPVQMAVLISAIANGGEAVTPKLVLGTSDENGVFTESAAYVKNRVMSERTAAKLRKMMVAVVEDGSGAPAKPEEGSAGGKTASAQTGQYDVDGNEIIDAWFAGFYPANEPKYAVVVLAEGMDSGSDYAAPLFKKICDGINTYLASLV